MQMLVCLLLAFCAYWWIKNARRMPTPPGPRGLPVLGNALGIPNEHTWLAFTHWARKYGPIVHLSILGSPIIVLNTREVIFDLLEKKNVVYSDRPVAPMAGELAGLRKYTALQPYGMRHREGRKMMQGLFSPRKAFAVHEVQETKANEFVSKLAQSPTDFRDHVRWLVAAIALQATYGLTASSADDHVIRSINVAVDEFSHISTPGAFLVDSLPVLKYIPEWFPGASFKTRARKLGELVVHLETTLYSQALELALREETTRSFVADFLRDHHYDPSPDEHKLCMEVSNHIYGGEQPTEVLTIGSFLPIQSNTVFVAGSDTTASAILSFFLIMAQHPAIQRKAQEEVDAFIHGHGRPPKCSDRPHMPYLDALLKEVHRCNPVLPIALPHYVRCEDVYAGYRIPAGSIVIGNSWAVLHDPALYPDPDEVIPERYLDRTDGSTLNPDPQEFAFGYGRRVCPGRTFAEDTLFVTAAMVLASFNVSDAVSPKGGRIMYTGGVLSHPEFTCTIIPRKEVLV